MLTTPFFSEHQDLTIDEHHEESTKAAEAWASWDGLNLKQMVEASTYNQQQLSRAMNLQKKSQWFYDILMFTNRYRVLTHSQMVASPMDSHPIAMDHPVGRNHGGTERCSLDLG